MQYLSAKEIAEKWGVSPILVRRLCRQGRVPGAVQKKDGWSIPTSLSSSRAHENVSSGTVLVRLVIQTPLVTLG